MESEGSPKAKAKRIRTRNSSQSEGEGCDGGVEGAITSLSNLQVGTKLEALDKVGKWYAARVIELDEENKEVLVHFERWNSRYDEFIGINSGRLRQLSQARQEELEREREKARKQLIPGDRIQAKWIDGRKYYGKVVKVHDTDVDLLFDDGVEYTTPIVSVRKQKPEKRVQDKESDCDLSTIEGRRQRAEKRKRSEESTIQSSSPSSSLHSTPPKKARRYFFDSDSTETESDYDDLNRLQGEAHHCKKVKQFKIKNIETSLASSELSPKTSENIQEVIKQKQLCKLSPLVKTAEMSYTEKELGSTPLSTFPSEEPLSTLGKGSGHGSSPLVSPCIAVSDSTPAETPPPSTTIQKTPSTSRPKRSMISPPKDTVAARTRAHTKFESVTRPKGVRKAGRGSGSKAASKQLVIAWDHNEFKCQVVGCTKSFRKESLLQSHIKHYHTPKTKHSSKGKNSSTGVRSKAHTPEPSKSPQTPKPSPEAKTSSSESKKAPDQDSTSSLVKTPHLPKSLPSLKSLEALGDELKKPEISVVKLIETPTKKHKTTVFDDEKSALTLSSKQKKDQKGDATKKHHQQGSKITTTSGKVATSHDEKATSHDGKAMSHDTKTELPKSDVKSDQLEKEEEDVPGQSVVPSTTDEQPSNDVVHCICGSDIDEGFMIQCEQCLCWQHGECIGIRSDQLPKKYVCYICCNPPGQRTRLKCKYSHDWYGEGTLPSISGGPPFPPSLNKAVLLSHQLTDNLYKVKKMIHSSEVKLQAAASNCHHPYLKQWAKECSHYSKDEMLSYLMTQLLPVSYNPSDAEAPEDADTQQQAYKPSDVEASEDADTQQQAYKPEAPEAADTQQQAYKLSTSEDADTQQQDEQSVMESSSVPFNGTKIEIDSETGSGTNDLGTKTESGTDVQDGTKNEDRTEGSIEPEGETRLEGIPKKRELRSSTMIQKNAVYQVPKRSKKSIKGSDSSMTPGENQEKDGEKSLCDTSSTTEGDQKSEALFVSVVSRAGCEQVDIKPLKLAPLPPLGKEELDTLTSVTSEVLKTSFPQAAGTDSFVQQSGTGLELEHPIPIVVPPPSHVTPEVAVGTSTTAVTQCGGDLGMMEIIDTNEFGVSEVPVFAMEVDDDHPKSTPKSTPLGTIAISSPQSATIPPNSFACSSQFTPVISASNNLISVGSSAPVIPSLSPKATANITSLSSTGLHQLSSHTGELEAVTLGDFAEAFMRGDTMHWFKKMKLLDHIESVQDNVQAWLNMIEEKLEGLPEEGDSSDDTQKILSEIHTTIRKLDECQRTVV